MEGCRLTEAQIIELAGWVFFTLGILPLFFSRIVIAFYYRLNEVLGRDVNLENPLWKPLAFRCYGLLMCLGGLYVIGR